MKNIVTADWLLENFTNEALVILDCRFAMSNPEYGLNAYKEAHIKNAKFISLEHDMAGNVEEHGGRHPLPDMQEFAKKLELIGVNDKSIVIIYDDGDLPAASRLWWMLKYIGKDNVYVLEGGFKEWTSRGLETTTNFDISSKSGELNVNLRSEMICDVDFVKNNIEKEGSIIIDSRANDRYLGLDEPIDKKGGHIKGAVNYFWQENFENGKFKKFEQLKEGFNKFKKYDNLIVHCGSGITACPNIIAMQEIGLEPVLYLGGWSDWVSYEENEIVGIEGGATMDENALWVLNQRVKRTMENLEKNNMEAYYVTTNKTLLEKVEELVHEGDLVSVGGSMTLFETGVIDFLRQGKYNFLDRYKDGLTPQQIKEIFRKSFCADVYLTSSNALTENGELYNVDGNGNRVAAMIYGPNMVIVIVGINKIVGNLEEAIKRNKKIAAPANCKRLNKKTPCTKLGYCIDCNSSDRICNDYVVIKRQGIKGRIKVIIVNEELGY